MKDRKAKAASSARPTVKKDAPGDSKEILLQNAVECASLVTLSPSGFLITAACEDGSSTIKSMSILDGGRFLETVSPERLPVSGAEWFSECIRKTRSVIINKIPPEGGPEFELRPGEAVSRLLAVPLVNEGDAVTIIGVCNKPNDYTDNDARMAGKIAGMVSDLAAESQRIEFLKAIMDVSNDWETLVDEKNIFRYCSANCEKITGFSCDDFKDNPNLYIEMVHPDDRMAVLDHFQEMHLNRDPSSLVFRMTTKSGEERWIELYCRAFYDAQGNYLGRRGSNRDVTDRKQLEISLKKKEESLERSQRIARVGHYEIDMQTGQIEMSQECMHIFGLDENNPRAALSGLMKAVHPDDLEEISSKLSARNFPGSEFDIHFRVVPPGGPLRFVRNIGRIQRDEAGLAYAVYGTIQDITTEKTIEIELSDSEKRFRDVLDNASSMAVQGYAPDGTTQYWNEASTRLYGYTKEEALGKNLLDLIIPPEMRDYVTGAIDQMAKTGISVPSAELSLMRKDGTRVDVFSSHTIVERSNREPELFCIDVDLSDIKNTEAALRESEGKFRSLVESISDIIFSIREDGTVIYVTPTWKQLFEADIEDAVGLSFLTFIHPEELSPILSLFENLLKTGEKIEGYELRIKDKYGNWQWHTVNASLQTDVNSDSRVIIGIMRNITEMKLAQQIRDAEVEIMNICHFAQTKDLLLRDLVDYFKHLTGLDAVGVRLHDAQGFPFFYMQGFSDDFLKTENTVCLRGADGQPLKDDNGLPILECMCGNILTGKIDIQESCFTRFGSFFTNSTSELTRSASRLKNLGLSRNNCNRYGYESVALFPLRAQGRTLGLFQFNDRRRDRFTPGLIQQLENLIDYASLALANLEAIQALRESEEKYRILIENAADAIFVLQDGYCTFCNPKMLETSGYSQDEIPARNFLDCVHPGDRLQVETYLSKRARGETAAGPIECRFNTKSGDTRWMELSTVPIRWMGKAAILNFMADITERKSAQLALLNSELKMQDLIDNLDGIVCAVDKNMNIQVFNAMFQMAHEDLFGRQVAAGDNITRLLEENNARFEDLQAIWKRVFDGEHAVIEREYEFGGQKRFDEISHIPIRNAAREIVGMTIMARDIYERKRAEQERRGLEERFFNAFHTSPDSISIHRIRDGIFIEVNQGFSVITGYSAAEVIGKSALDVDLWEDPADRDRLIEALKNTGEMLNYEVKTRTKNGENKFCLMSARIISVNGERCVLMISRDISDRKLAESRLKEQIEELRRWHAVTLGRETRIIDLKNEVNELLIKAGKPPRYVVSGESHHA